MKRNQLQYGFFSVCALILLNTPALAAKSVPNAWYVEGNVGGTTQPQNVTIYANTIDIGVPRKIGYNADVGYKFSQYFGVEIGYTNFSPPNVYEFLSDDNDFDVYGYYKIGNMNNAAYDLAGKFIYPIYDTGLEVFGKLGVSYLMSTFSKGSVTDIFGEDDEWGESFITIPQSHYSTGLYYGAGIAYYFEPEWGVNIQYAQANGTSSTGSYGLISGGITAIFG